MTECFNLCYNCMFAMSLFNVAAAGMHYVVGLQRMPYSVSGHLDVLTNEYRTIW